MAATSTTPILIDKAAADTWKVVLAGDWTGEARPGLGDVLSELNAAQNLKKLSFDSKALGKWDSFLLISLERLHKVCVERSIEFDITGLPEGAQGLLRLAWAVPERAGARREAKKESYFVSKGKNTLAKLTEFHAALGFTGELVLGGVRSRKSHHRGLDSSSDVGREPRPG